MLTLPYLAFSEESTPYSIPNTATHKITAKELKRSYTVFIKKPLGYDQPQNSLQQYPVIYLNDGPYTFPVASGVTHLPMGASNKFDRAFLVGISYAEGENGMSSRVRDFTPIKDSGWVNYTTGGAPEYLRFIEKELIPYVETKYRIDSKNRTLSGQSLGGSFGAWVMFNQPDLFSSYILTSPSLWYKNKFIFDLEKTYAKTNNDLKAQVYFAVGEKESISHGMKHPMVEQLLAFEKILKARQHPNLKLKVEVITDAIHETTFPQGFTRGAQWIFENQPQ